MNSLGYVSYSIHLTEFADFPKAKIKVMCSGRNTIEVMLCSSQAIITRGHVTSPRPIIRKVDFDHVVKITPASFMYRKVIITFISIMWETHCGILRQLRPGEL